MDFERVAREVGERLELRGIDPMLVFSDLAANAAWYEIVGDVIADMHVQELVYGGMSNGGQFTGLLNLPGVEIDRSDACWNCGVDTADDEGGCEYCRAEPGDS